MSYLEFWCLFFSDVISGIAISAVKRCMFNVRNENKNARLLMQTYWYGIWDMTTDEQPNSIEWFLYFALILRNVFFSFAKWHSNLLNIVNILQYWKWYHCDFFSVCVCVENLASLELILIYVQSTDKHRHTFGTTQKMKLSQRTNLNVQTQNGWCKTHTHKEKPTVNDMNTKRAQQKTNNKFQLNFMCIRISGKILM